MSSDEPITGLGTRSDFLAPVPSIDPARLKLSPEELVVFACIGRAAQISDIVMRCGLPEPRAIALLLALRAKGAIVPAKMGKAVEVGPTHAAASEQVDLDDARKAEILELERKLDSVNHFELLGVPVGADTETVRAAYYELSKRIHPDRFFGRNLGSFRPRLEAIFRRVSEANQVLCDPNRRADYLKANPSLAGTAAPPRTKEDEARGAERRARFAKHPYLAKAAKLNDLVGRARGMLSKKDYQGATAQLNAAAQLVPEHPEVKQLLAEAKKQSEQHRAEEELKKAERAEAEGNTEAAIAAYRAALAADPQCFRAALNGAKRIHRSSGDEREARSMAQRAVELNPRSIEAHVLLGNLLLAAGLKAGAQRQFEEALKLDPDNAEAKKHAKKWWPF